MHASALAQAVASIAGDVSAQLQSVGTNITANLAGEMSRVAVPQAVVSFLQFGAVLLGSVLALGIAA